MNRIVIVVPVLNRPHRVQPLIESVQRATRVPYRLLFVVNANDRPEIAALKDARGDYITFIGPLGRGEYARKINLGYQSSTEPFIFTGADDLEFHAGWDVAALERMHDSTVGVVGTNDLGNPKVLAGEHSTHSLIRRSYADTYGTIDQPGAIYCEEYPHEFCDDELVETAKYRNAWAMAPGSIVEHLHPHWNKAPTDRIYAAAPARLSRGRAVYNRRKHLWARPGSLGTALVDVVIATYGSDAWKDHASRAIKSVELQTVQPTDIHYIHGTNLADARNEGAARSSSPWLCFLDADDTLHSSYLHAMSPHLPNSRFLLNPAVQFVKPEGPERPKIFRPRDLRQGNYLVIGTLITRDRFLATGGFDPKWRAYEDWPMWWRAVELGGRVKRVPNAIYIAQWRADGRNNTVIDPEKLCEEIRADHDEWTKTRTGERV